ncbi:MAG: type II toxin-antitoxin system RelE/ParE family toxin [Actinomycetota bacterium]|nr:MAG: type II toxin-antitoxin system RelE/ParE family toxin [Actinomycetota bacterium]
MEYFKINGFDRTFRIRFRSYRIIYDIYDKNNRVIILRILRRSEKTYKFR